MTTEEAVAVLKRVRAGELNPHSGDARQAFAVVADAYFADHPEPSPANEALAANLRLASWGSDGKPEGTRESLERCSRMLDTYGPECFPANESGQIHFARAMMETTADEIRAYLAANPVSDPTH